MKTIHLSILLLVLASASASAKTPWESYLTLPIPERASNVIEIEYSPEAAAENDMDRARDLGILRDQVLACDRESFRLAYRLIENADSGLRESLISILSHTIRTRPEFFLKEMSSLNPDQDVLRSILTASGSEYKDRSYARRYELYMRRMALTDVSDLKLSDFRNTCLEMIEIH